MYYSQSMAYLRKKLRHTMEVFIQQETTKFITNCKEQNMIYRAKL